MSLSLSDRLRVYAKIAGAKTELSGNALRQLADMLDTYDAAQVAVASLVEQRRRLELAERRCLWWLFVAQCLAVLHGNDIIAAFLQGLPH